MKVFISCPMKDRTENEILAERNFAKSEIKERFGDEDIQFIDSYFKEFKLNEQSLNTAVYCLGRAIVKLSEADIVVFCRGWELARGCRIEHTIAQDYGMDIILL